MTPMIKRFLIVSIIISIGIMFSAQENPSPPPAQSSQNFHVQIEKKKWEIYLQQVGSKKTYRDVKTTYDHSSNNLQHIVVHMIGAILYEHMGTSGLVICDDAFAYGCYHGFFGAAMQDIGLSKLHEMDTVCIKHFGNSDTACQHGIGHGMLASIGNDQLIKALQQCDTLQWQGRLAGCRGGIFMEYNFNTITHMERVTARKLDISFPYTPCQSLPKKYQYACYFAQPEWWNTVYKKDYKKIGSLCNKLLGENKDICFLGSGVIAAKSSTFDISKTIKKCDDMPSGYTAMLCKAGAAWTYKAAKQETQDISLLCNSVTQSLQHTCMEKSQAI